ncbi:GNAT family N-acetyltransferase [Vibrio scophthalmi]|uniref:Acyltransferase n=1 Tax=Vibrio scophthalmi LMG 19158 TaxID=870967 RepID=F9RKG0_9VIBR|nr:GNAT family N-acetyltransferase [Vibrio scophthalmi]EGU39789.1 acyltransferase [Vibrio scophthalmi LMG 19158]
MHDLRIEMLDPIKLPLVSRLYKAHYPSGKAKKNEATIVGYQNNQLVCVVRFRPIEQYQLLTGMLVIPEQRAHGFGHQLLNYCQQTVCNSRTFCFAYPHLEEFYQQHGFITLREEQLPNGLSQLFTRYISSGKALIPMHYRIPKTTSPNDVI